MTPLLSIENLTVEYAVGGKTLFAVSDVSLEVGRGETLGLVGESGCGKSTLGPRRPAAAPPDRRQGDLRRHRAHRARRRGAAPDAPPPAADLPGPDRLAQSRGGAIGDIVAEPLVIIGVKDRGERERRVREVLAAVGLDPDLVDGPPAA